MYADLTKNNWKFYNLSKKSIAENGYPPAIREICAGVNLKSTSSVHKYIQDLVDMGYLKKSASKKRALEVVSPLGDFSSTPTFDVPIVGSVAAGLPIFAEENIQDTLPLPIDLARKGELFILNVKGDSMIEMGILDGDSVIVRQQNTAENGDVIVALIDDSATVKRFYKKKDYFVLKPENSEMDPIVTKEIAILGKVIGVYRLL